MRCWSRAWLLPLPLLATALTLAPREAEARRVVYINTDALTVNAGPANDPSTDTINVNGFTTTDMDGWTGATPEQIEELLWLLKQTTVPWDVEFVLERPAMGPYDMIVFGSADDHASSFGGNCSTQVGLSDCSDDSGVSIGFLFWGCLDMDDQLDTHRVAFHTLGALGYGWGMENVAGTGQVMAGYSANGLKYGEACSNLSGASNCMHAGCAMGQQNGSAEMMDRHGARVDDGPPSIEVISPQAGEEVESPFNVQIRVNDAFGGVTTSLALVEYPSEPAVDDAFPFAWNGIMLPDGAVTLRIGAIDADGNEVSTDVPVCVGGPCETGESGETEESGTEEDEGGESSGNNDEVGESGPSAGDEGGGGCSMADAGRHGAIGGFGGGRGAARAAAAGVRRALPGERSVGVGCESLA
ncbi:MAG: hypothetical protein HC927_04495 [Deltaproteobacteria bacterium]|nr:hypothetical protein [Deltaproteobacteria bacterium]